MYATKIIVREVQGASGLPSTYSLGHLAAVVLYCEEDRVGAISRDHFDLSSVARSADGVRARRTKAVNKLA